MISLTNNNDFTAKEESFPVWMTSGILKLTLNFSTQGGIDVSLGGRSFEQLFRAASPDFAPTTLELIQRFQQNRDNTIGLNTWHTLAGGGFIARSTSFWDETLDSLLEKENVAFEDFERAQQSLEHHPSDLNIEKQESADALLMLRVYKAAALACMKEHHNQTAAHRAKYEIGNIDAKSMHFPFMGNDMYIYGDQYDAVLATIRDNLRAIVDSLPHHFIDEYVDQFMDELQAWDGEDTKAAQALYNAINGL
jgi:hypothetical protein